MATVGLPKALRGSWLAPDFGWTVKRVARWAQLAGEVAVEQQARLAALDDRPKAPSIARSESAAALLSSL